MKISCVARLFIKCLMVCSACSGIPSAQAAFGVSEYQSPEVYGNAQTPCFRGAMTGARALTPEEEDELAGLLPLREVGRYYGRFSVNTGPLTLSGLTNRSIVAVGNNDANGVVTINSRKRSQVGLEFAVGYVWSKSMRGEIEYLVNRNFTYSASPVLSNLPAGAQARSLNATITNNTFLANLYYDFIFAGYDRFRPFVTGGIGVAVNGVQSTISPNTITGGAGGVYAQSQKTKQSGSFAFAVGGGFRFSVFSRWFVNVSLRYISLGTPTFELGNAPNQFRIRGNYSYFPLSIGVSYIF